MRALLSLVLLLCLAHVAPLRAQAPALYTGEAVVADQSDGQRAEGMKAALSQVVVKLTGDRNVLTRESVAKGVAEAERFVQQYSYRQDVVSEAGKPVVKLTLKGNKFEPAEIDAPANKPFVLEISNQDGTPAEFESKPLRAEKVVAAGGKITLQVRALQPGRYRFIDDYHEASAFGFLNVK